jgi:RND superfamily putative drug exporter
MERWARFVSRTAWLWIIAWPIVSIVVWAPAPRIPTLLEDDDTGFLPADVPSELASAKLREEFPEHAPASRAAIVFVREAGLTDQDRELIASVARTLAARSPELGWHVKAVATTPYLKPVLESPDGRAAVIDVDLPAELLTHSTVNRVREIKRVLAEHAPGPGLEAKVTGSGALGELVDANTKRDVDNTTIWAFVAVTIILLVIYRSPVAMLLPLVTIGFSLMLALGIIGWAAAIALPINGLVEMFVVVMVVGTGTDYCLFLFSRFREEAARTADVVRSVEVSVARSGTAILASAGTNAVGLATLALAGNRNLYTSGPTISFAICVGTLAVLTLTPSLLRIVGAWLFWPGSVETTTGSTRGPWAFIGRLATRRPIAVALVTAGVLLPTAVLGGKAEPLYDAYEEYPPDCHFVRGARLYEQHFFQRKGVSEQTLILSTDARLDGPEAQPALGRALDAIAEALRRDFPVLYQRDLQDPLGQSRSAPAVERSGLAEQVIGGFTGRLARDFYIGRSGAAVRIDLGLAMEARSVEAMQEVPRLRSAVLDAVEKSGLPAAVGASSVRVDLTGETPLYADMRNLRIRDFRIVAVAAITLIYLILIWLIRSPVQSVILVAATILTYLTTYGATGIVFNLWHGLEGLSWQVDFLLFIIILSLGQDYNIFVVTRIREELHDRPPDEAVATAIRKTGRVVSSCGVIMAATFGSMLAGSLIIMKEFAVALAMGILIDTFIVRPLLVPALILLLYRFRRPRTQHSVATS